MLKIIDKPTYKLGISPDFNFVFDKTDGYTEIYGETKEDNPIMSLYGPMIADIEITTICKKGCPFCYKSNTKNGSNMSFETFKKILDTLPQTLTQVALGTDSDLTSNPDLWKMLDYCRSKGIVPNLTLAKCTTETAHKLVQVCGAVAVSHYGDYDSFYYTISRLHHAKLNLGEQATLKQINIHQMISTETEGNALYLINTFNKSFIPESKTKLSDMVNAIVFLSLKQRGRGQYFTKLEEDKWNYLITTCLDNNIPFGFDSCSACKVAQTYKSLGKEVPLQYIESCESTLYSAYFDIHGNFYPCSFNEESKYAIPIDSVQDFYRDLWFHDKTNNFRKQLLSNKDEFGLNPCPSYEV